MTIFSIRREQDRTAASDMLDRYRTEPEFLMRVARERYFSEVGDATIETVARWDAMPDSERERYAAMVLESVHAAIDRGDSPSTAGVKRLGPDSKLRFMWVE